MFIEGENVESKTFYLSNAIMLEGFIDGWYDYIVSVIYKNGNLDYEHYRAVPSSKPHTLEDKSFKNSKILEG